MEMFYGPRKKLCTFHAITLFGIAFLLAAGASKNSFAQSIPTAERKIGLNLFAAGTRLSTDFNSNDNGVTVGADLTRYRSRFSPSLEVRYTWSTGNVVGENSVLGGIKLETAFRRVHPYGDVLVGYGTVRFDHPALAYYTHDNSVVYGAGGGVEYMVLPRIALKADAQYQHWHLGEAAGSLTPHAFSLGVTYRFPPKS